MFFCLHVVSDQSNYKKKKTTLFWLNLKSWEPTCECTMYWEGEDGSKIMDSQESKIKIKGIFKPWRMMRVGFCVSWVHQEISFALLSRSHAQIFTCIPQVIQRTSGDFNLHIYMLHQHRPVHCLELCDLNLEFWWQNDFQDDVLLLHFCRLSLSLSTPH